DLRHGLQPLADLQARGAGFSVNKNFGHENFQVQQQKRKTEIRKYRGRPNPKKVPQNDLARPVSGR
ncbi:MAG: hypothetical protein O9327_08825, partial [Polaromonas sp.]|nr:hypothetical protein [Polaromonas sp.]